MPVLRDRRDRTDLLLTLAPPLAVVVLPSPVTVALAVWWLGNTVAHQAVHRRLFTSARLERLFSAWSTLLLGVPQRAWRQRHLAHHAQRPWRPRAEPWLLVELALLAAAWTALAIAAPAWLL